MQYVLMFLLFAVSLFLILIVLVQRGRGGGLAGAFGGMGGQSAFGTKAGDLFTRITIVAAAIWILLCMLTVRYLSTTGDIVGGRATPTFPAPAAAPQTGDTPDFGTPPATVDGEPAGEPAFGEPATSEPAATGDEPTP